MTPHDYDYLRGFLKERSGLDLAADKQYLVEGRLMPLARQAELAGIGELVEQIKARNDGLSVALVEAMTINETLFFRDKVPFDQLRAAIVPMLMKRRADRKVLRVWCAASSTGEEPYSVAICLKEMAALLTGWRIEILATDLSQRVLEKAEAGLYTQFEVQRGLPIQMLMKYFRQAGQLWQVNAEIRAMVQYRQLNLLKDFGQLGRFDIVLCRNVLIYFDGPTKRRVLGRLAEVMESDGVLVLGAAETVIGLGDAFGPWPGHQALYRPAAALM